MKKALVSGSQRCWFAVDSKIFECSVEVIGSRLEGVILERSRGYSSWIRFGLSSLSFLLEGVESCCRQKVGKSLPNDGRKMEEGSAWRRRQMGQEITSYARFWIWRQKSSVWCSLKAEA